MKRFKEYTNDSINEGNDNESYFRFLTILRDSGKTNMFGAAPYLQKTFGLSSSEARKILADWMKSFNEAVTEGTFYRLPKDINTMENLKIAVEILVGRYKHGDDYDPKLMNAIEGFIKEIKKSAKAFKSKDDVEGTVYKY
jgi:hypothetical protein